MLCADVSDGGGSEAARLGTAIHFISEKALRDEMETLEWIDRFVKVEKHDIHIDESAVDCANMYVDYVRAMQTQAADIEIEARLSMLPLDPNDAVLAEVRGSSDTVAFWPDRGIIEVVDLKSGRGYMVPADSKQLRLYGLMAMLTYKPKVPWREIRTTIVQPHDPDESQRIRTRVYTPDELWDFVGEVYTAIHAALQPDAPLVPGPEQCQWCPARSKCPALAQTALDVAKSAFASAPLHSGSPMPAPGAEPSLPSLNGVTNEQLAVWLERRELVDAWFKGIEKLAADRMTVGQNIRGWKMVQRTGNRKWTDPETVPTELRKLGVQTAQMFSSPKLLTPKQIERLVKDKTSLVPLYDRANNGLAMVPDTNKKPAAAGVFGPAPSIESR